MDPGVGGKQQHKYRDGQTTRDDAPLESVVTEDVAGAVSTVNVDVDTNFEKLRSNDSGLAGIDSGLAEFDSGMAEFD